MQALKLRLILAGCIVSALGAILFLARGHSPALLGVLVVGLALLAVGLLWRKPKNAGTPKDAG